MSLVWFVHKAMHHPQGNIIAASMREGKKLWIKQPGPDLTEAAGWNMKVGFISQ